MVALAAEEGEEICVRFALVCVCCQKKQQILYFDIQRGVRSSYDWCRPSIHNRGFDAAHYRCDEWKAGLDNEESAWPQSASRQAFGFSFHHGCGYIPLVYCNISFNDYNGDGQVLASQLATVFASKALGARVPGKKQPTWTTCSAIVSNYAASERNVYDSHALI